MIRWYRSDSNIKIAGICGGLSEMFNIDVTILRFIFFWFIFITPLNFAYFIAWFVVPKKGELNDNDICSCCGSTKTSSTSATQRTTTTNSTSTQEFLAG